MGFTVPAPVRRQPQFSLNNAVQMVLQFQMHRRRLRQDQIQFEEELEHRKDVSKRMTAHQAIQTNRAVAEADARIDLFDAQEESIRKKTAFDSSPEGQMLKFGKLRKEGQDSITKTWFDMYKESSPDMTNATRAEMMAHVLASSRQAQSLDPSSTMSGFLPDARQTLNPLFASQSNQDMRTARSFIEQFEEMDKADTLRTPLTKSIGTLRRIASGDQFPRREIDRVFNAFQFGLDPEAKIDLPFWFTGGTPTRKLTDEQLTQFREAGRGTAAEKRLMNQEGLSRGLPGFVPLRQSRDPNQPRDPVFEQFGEDISGVSGTLGLMNFSDSRQPQVVRTQEEYDRLPSGTVYIDVNGNQGTKP